MPVPTGTVLFDPGSSSGSSSNAALLLRLPEDVWNELESDITVTVNGNSISLNLPSRTVNLDSNPTQPLEILHYSSQQFRTLATSTSRLSVPLSAFGTGAAERLKRQSDALDRERKERAERVTGQRPAKRGEESPAPSKPPSSSQQLPPPSQGIPLKTRVVQLLALGAITMNDVVRRVGGAEEDVSRVVRVVGRPVARSDKYTLAPGQYAKVKIASWSYTRNEKETVIRLARAAFDELGLDADAEEREELVRKEAEAFGSESTQSPPSERTTVPISPRIQAPSESSSSASTGLVPPPTAVKSKSPTRSTKDRAQDKDRTKVGKQIAKFRAEHVKRNSSLTRGEREEGGVDGEEKPVSKGKEDVKEGEREEREREREQEKREKEREQEKKEKEKQEREKEKEREKAKQDKEREREREKERAKEREHEREKEDRQKQREKERKEREREKADKDKADKERDKERSDKDKLRNKPPAANGKRKRDDEVSRKDTDSRDKRDREKDREKNKHRRQSPVYTSSEGSDSDSERERGRTREKRPVTSSRPNGIPRSMAKPNGRTSTSSPMPKFSRNLDAPPDPEELRERYEELFPAYEQLSARLAALHSAAEGSRGRAGDVEMVAEDEVRKLVARWEKWHRELEGIRRWFSE